MKLFFKTLIYLLLSTQHSLAANSLLEDHQILKEKAHTYLTNELNQSNADYAIQIRHIDPRLKLKKCPTNIEIKLTQAHVKPGKNTLSVRCTSDTPWRIFMTAQVKLFTHVVVSKQPLNKGHVIQKSDVHLQRVELTHRRSSHLSNNNQAINYVLKRRVDRGDIIRANNLSKPILIKKGDTVTILARNSGFKISMKGIALMSGGKGEKIKVKNIRTKKIIQGIIFDAHTIKVNI